VSRQGKTLAFDVSRQTLNATALGALKPGMPVNLEKPLSLGENLGGHLVLGHVDGVGKLLSKKAVNAQTTMMDFWIPAELTRYMVPKGSVAIDGVSLTAARVAGAVVTAAIIPHTLKHTNLGAKRPGDPLNVEADILAKHVEKLLAPHKGKKR
jgi:riboflavin synthase